MTNRHPIILCHGILGWGPEEMSDFHYWGAAHHVAKELEVNVDAASLGPISSHHDRACELAAQIRGGGPNGGSARTDFGQEHAEHFGHQRFGKQYPGIHPNWSETEPVHLVGHSMGGQTIRYLQKLLEDDAFGWGSNANWIKSVTTIGSPLNGATLPHMFGLKEEDGTMPFYAPIRPLLGMVDVLGLVLGDGLKTIYDMDLEHWNGIHPSLGVQASWLEDRYFKKFLKGKDHAFYDVTIHAAIDFNQHSSANPDTYYFSHATHKTNDSGFVSWPQPDMTPVLYGFATYMGSKYFFPKPYESFKSSEWFPSDGVVNTVSMTHPFVGKQQLLAGVIQQGAHYLPGRWYTRSEKDTDHLELILPTGHHKKQTSFYRDLFQRLQELP